MKKKVIIYLFILFIVIFILFTPTSRFLFGFAGEQARLILRSEKISTVISEGLASPKIISQLQLVPEIMSYGDNAGFPETKAYSKYTSVDREAFYHTLSGSKKDAFEDYTWWWPIIGTIPYKGFIDSSAAVSEGEKLRRKGYDTYISNSSAMSTFGILPDPIVQTMIDENDSTVLIETIYHERTHQLFFRKNDVTFNENAAVLIGNIVALDFARSRFGENSSEFRTLINRTEDLLLFSEFLERFYQELDGLYKSDKTKEQKLAEREIIFSNKRDEFNTIKTQLHASFKKFNEREINNAYILTHYRYYGKFSEYYRVHERLGSNPSATLQFFNATAQQKEAPDLVIATFLD